MVLRGILLSLCLSFCLPLSSSSLSTLKDCYSLRNKFAQVQRHTRDIVKEKLKKLPLFPPEAKQVGDHGCFVQWAKLKAPSQELLNTQATLLPGPSLPTTTHSQQSKSANTAAMCFCLTTWIPTEPKPPPSCELTSGFKTLVKNLVAKWTSVQIVSSSPGLQEAHLSQMISALSAPHTLWSYLWILSEIHRENLPPTLPPMC